MAVITGPAGTGKTTVLASIARAWDRPVFGTATSQNATNGLRHAGIRVAANTTRLLDDLQRGQIPPGSLIVADEASMISVTHLAALTKYAARNRCKLILAGDQEQLAAVEGGGAMTPLADRLGYVQLAEPSGSPPPGNAPPPCACAPETRRRWMSTASTAGSAAPRPRRPWIRPPVPTSPAT